MTTWFISRHAGAVEWAQRKGISVDRWVQHLNPADVDEQDTVIGTLPIHLAADICSRGARFLFLTLDMRADQRGRELSADDLDAADCRLTEYVIKRISDA